MVGSSAQAAWWAPTRIGPCHDMVVAAAAGVDANGLPAPFYRSLDAQSQAEGMEEAKGFLLPARTVPLGTGKSTVKAISGVQVRNLLAQWRKQ
ncbi:unnamed protein product [Urochloa humidicola]